MRAKPKRRSKLPLQIQEAAATNTQRRNVRANGFGDGGNDCDIRANGFGDSVPVSDGQWLRALRYLKATRKLVTVKFCQSHCQLGLVPVLSTFVSVCMSLFVYVCLRLSL